MGTKDYATEEVSNNTHMHFSRGTYWTPDRTGFVEFNSSIKEWDAWREDIEGITAHFTQFEDAVSYAYYG